MTPIGAEMIRRRPQKDTIVKAAAAASAGTPHRRRWFPRLMLSLLLPVLAGMIRLGPGPVISVPPIIVNVHPGGAENSTFRGVAINVSFSAENQMRTARRLIRSGHLTKALMMYQHVLTAFGTHLIRVGPGRYISIRDYVWRVLYKSPAAKNGLYDQIFGLAARKLINEAVAGGHQEAILSACNQYLLTSAAVSAMIHLADRLFEAGHFSRALRIYRELLPNPAARYRQPSILFRAATAAIMAGHPRISKRYRDELEKQYPTAEGTIDGQRQNLPRALTFVLTHLKSQRYSGAVYAGTIPPGRVTLSGKSAVPNTVLWNQRFGGLTIKVPTDAAAQQVLINSVTSAMSAFGLNAGNLQSGGPPTQLMFSFPVVHHHVVFVDTLSQIEALDASSGYPHWVYPRTAATSNAQSMANLAFISIGADQICCSVADQRVVGLMTRRVAGEHVGNAYPINPMYNYLYRPQAYHIVCLSEADGSLLWRRSSHTLIGTAIASPMLTGGGVFLLTADRHGNGMQVRLSVTKLSLQTGATVWTHYLCTISGQAFEPPSLNIQATSAGGRLYIATGAGADMAVSQQSGRICWLDYTVDPVPVSNNPFGYGVPSVRVPPWKLNPPIVTHRQVVTAVSSAHRIWQVNVYRRDTGERLISFVPPAKLGLTILAGVTAKAIILTGARTAAFNRTNGKILWVGTRSSGNPNGRPVLTSQLLYLPTHRWLITENLSDGHLAMREPWPMGQDGRRGEPGNLAIGHHGLIAVNDDSIYSYARWKEALAYLIGRIRREPDRPVNYLTLSQVAFAAGHIKLCKKSLQQSLDVARRSHASDIDFNILFRGAMDFALRARADHHIPPSDVTYFFGAAAAAARDPARQAMWRFAEARYLLSRHHPRRALALCQQILISPSMRQTALTLNGNTLPAEAVLVAFIQLRIINVYGTAVYQPWQAAADKLISSAANSSVRLSEVAYGYPNSPSAQIAAKALLRLLLDRQQWEAAYRVALMALAGLPHISSPVSVQEGLATALLHLHHFREAFVVAHAALQFPHLTAAQHSVFHAVLSSVQGHVSSLAAAMVFTPKSSFSISRPTRGNLLIPAQKGSQWRCRSGMLLLKPRSTTLRFMRPDGRLARWSLRLGNVFGRVALLGTRSGISILVAPQSMIAVDIKTGTVLWHRHFGNVVKPGSHLSLNGYSDINRPIEPFIPPSPQPNFVYINGVMQAAPSGVNMEPLLPVMARIVRDTGPIQFSFIRWTHAGLLIGIAGRVMLLNPRTGREIWPQWLSVKSDGRLTSARSVGSSLILAFGHHYHRVAAVNESDGRLEATESLSAPGGYERMLSGPDNMLFLIGARHSSAFKVAHEKLALIWSRRIINPMPRLAARTFLGVAEMLHDGIVCLNAATGTTRWHIPVLTGAMSGIAAGDMDLRTFADTVVARTPSNLAAYSADSGEIRWRAEIMTRQTPPLVRMCLADPDIVLLACGPAGALSRSEKLILINQRDRYGRLDNGSIVLSKPLVISATDGNGPVIQSWYVLDNSIIFSLDGRIFAYHAGR
jgi:outer membrane protein assembly factor BamB